MVDKSWGGDTSATVRIRTNDSLSERSAARAEARAARALERTGAVAERLEARAIRRDADVAEREAARVARREAEAKAATGDPHAAAAKRHRTSGRKDVVREQRDTRHYTTVIDVGRIQALAKRGASVAGLAAAFGITQDAVEQALAEPTPIEER